MVLPCHCSGPGYAAFAWWAQSRANPVASSANRRNERFLCLLAGKFYELFEMDAFTGVDVLGLQFMKGDQPHAVRLCDRLMFVD